MAFTKNEVLNKIIDNPIIPVFYNANLQTTLKIIEACYLGGVRAFEFTNRGDQAYSVFSEASKFVRSQFPDLALGIGTIFTKTQAQQFYDAGADFIVQPVTTKEVGDFCNEKNIAWAPGAGTTNEVYQASLLGAELIKLFPGNTLSPEFVKALKGPLPDVKVMVTGGVEPTVESVTAWFKAGVTSVGIGSQLFPKDQVEKGDFIKISENLKLLFSTVVKLKS